MGLGIPFDELRRGDNACMRVRNTSAYLVRIGVGGFGDLREYCGRLGVVNMFRHGVGILR